MLRISTNGRYALRTMLDLALHGKQEPVLRQDLARRQNISAEYVAQISRLLVKAGLIKGVKGPGGGYILGRSPESITAGDVIRAVEGPIAAVYCVLAGKGSLACTRTENCATHLLWVRLSKTIEEFLDSITLKDLHTQALWLEQAHGHALLATDNILAPVAALMPSQSDCLLSPEEKAKLERRLPAAAKSNPDFAI